VHQAPQLSATSSAQICLTYGRVSLRHSSSLGGYERTSRASEDNDAITCSIMLPEEHGPNAQVPGSNYVRSSISMCILESISDIHNPEAPDSFSYTIQYMYKIPCDDQPVGYFPIFSAPICPRSRTMQQSVRYHLITTREPRCAERRVVVADTAR
jgi:hypothetical protein